MVSFIMYFEIPYSQQSTFWQPLRWCTIHQAQLAQSAYAYTLKEYEDINETDSEGDGW